ncbi:MAG: AI-2E family transporter [Fidelibacterota bacterium]
MTDTPKPDALLKIYRLVVGLLAVGFLYFIWPYISSVITMLIFTFLLTTILLPGVDYLERKINSRGLSVAIISLVSLTILVVFLASFVSNFADQARDFSGKLNQQDYITSLSNLIHDKLPSFDLASPENKTALVSKVQGYVKSTLQNILSMVGTIGGFLFTLIMVLIFTIILLYEYHHFKKSLVRFIPNKYFEVGLRMIFNIERQISSYLRGQLLAAASVSVMSIIGLLLLNMGGANLTLVVFIGIIAGLANLIPLVGPFVGMIPAIVIAVMNNLGNEQALNHILFGIMPIPSPFYIFDIMLMFLIVQQVDNNFITPVLVGDSVGLHPILVMIALLIGGTLIGPMGMLFAVPAAGVMKVIFQEVSFITKNSHLL